MSKIINIINAGGSSAPLLFLDEYTTTEYFYSLNRGGADTTNVAELRNADNEYQFFTPEQLEDATFTTFNGGGETRISELVNQGTVARNLEQPTIANMPNVGNPNLYKFNDRIYMSGVERNSVMATGIDTPILDKDSTVYLTYRSQNGIDIGGMFEDISLVNISEKVVIYSDIRASNFRLVNYSPTGINAFINFNTQQPANTLRMLALRRTGNLVEAYDENGLVGSITSANEFASDTFLTIFRQTAGSLFFKGHLAELIVREQSDTDIIDIINNRKNYYGI